MWLNLESAEAEAIRELDTLSDRAAAIVGATILEARLVERLRHELRDLVIKPQVTMHGRMLNHSGALGTFSARINLGFMMKLYDETTWRDLDLIRDLRNDFAHLTAIGSFSADSVRDRCGNLKACDRYFAEPPEGDRSLFVADGFTPDGSPNITIYYPGLADRLKNPRQRYMLSIMYYALLLKLPLVVRWGRRPTPPDPQT